MKRTGIYQILNTANNSIYIGSTIDLDHRQVEHFRSLRHGRHANSQLQADFNKYGISSFTFSVLEVLPNSSTNQQISEREQYFTGLAHLNGQCYNRPLALLRPIKNRTCAICGSRWHYSKDMCKTHYDGWRRAQKRGFNFSPAEFIALQLSKKGSSDE